MSMLSLVLLLFMIYPFSDCAFTLISVCYGIIFMGILILMWLNRSYFSSFSNYASSVDFYRLQLNYLMILWLCMILILLVLLIMFLNFIIFQFGAFNFMLILLCYGRSYFSVVYYFSPLTYFNFSAFGVWLHVFFVLVDATTDLSFFKLYV